MSVMTSDQRVLRERDQRDLSETARIRFCDYCLSMRRLVAAFLVTRHAHRIGAQKRQERGVVITVATRYRLDYRDGTSYVSCVATVKAFMRTFAKLGEITQDNS